MSRRKTKCLRKTTYETRIKTEETSGVETASSSIRFQFVARQRWFGPLTLDISRQFDAEFSQTREHILALGRLFAS